MWIKRANRRELAELLQFQHVGLVSDVRQTEHVFRRGTAGSGDDIEVVWKHDPRITSMAPSICLVSTERQRDFFAWVTTYVPSLRPLTAFSHVIDPRIFEQLQSVDRPPTLGQFQDAVLGIILCETATYLGGKRDVRSITPLSCFSTLSFSLGRAFALGIPPQLTEDLPEKWARARFIAGTTSIPVPLALLQRVWSALAMTLHNNLFYLGSGPSLPIWNAPSPVIIRACEEVRQGNSPSLFVWEGLSHGIPELLNERDKLMGPKEARVRLLEKALRQLMVRPFDDDTASFFAAYLASAISPGSLEHLPILIPLLRIFPDVLLWYGLLAGLSPQATISSSVDGLSRKVARELLRHDQLPEAPFCDVSLAELEILRQSVRSLSDLKVASTSTLIIELFPLINASYKFKTEELVNSAISGEALNALYELERQVANTSLTIDRLKRSLGLQDQGETEVIRKQKKRIEKG